MSTSIPAMIAHGPAEKTYKQMLDYGLKPEQVIAYAFMCLQDALENDPYIHKLICETARRNKNDL